LGDVRRIGDAFLSELTVELRLRHEFPPQVGMNDLAVSDQLDRPWVNEPVD